jgi:hypothetical protein
MGSFLGLVFALLLTAGPAFAGHVESIACAQHPALTGAVTTSAGSCTTSVASGATLTDTINQEFVVSTSPLTKTSDTALATVTGLSIALTAGKTYQCTGHLTITASGASGGIKVALVASNSLSATSASFTAANWNGTVQNARSTATSLGSAIGAATAAVTDVDQCAGGAKRLEFDRNDGRHQFDPPLRPGELSRA